VFGSGNYAATGNPDKDEEGIVCFITVAGFLNGPGFEKMRADLRESCSEIWVVDCSPEGHQPNVSTRVFQGVQQPVCITLAARKLSKSNKEPAWVHFHALPKGSREQKFDALVSLSLHGTKWADGPRGWRDPFLPAAAGAWAAFPALKDLFIYDGSGVMPGRTWIIAPDVATLGMRWARLASENDPETKELLFHPHLRDNKPGDKHVRKSLAEALAGHEERLAAVIDDKKPIVDPIRYGFRFLDRQWIIPDARLINQPNPTLWKAQSSRQVYLTALEAHSPSSGPAVTFTGQIPDLHHYKGSFGGRAHPLWRDRESALPNIKPTLLAHLAKTFAKPVKAEDVMAYLAAVVAHPAFTTRFKRDLVQPGLRVPLTADAKLFAEATALGSEVIWLHTYGERFVDASAGRPKGPPRLPKDSAPFIPSKGAIRGAPEPLPDTMDYDPATRRLTTGKGYIENVTPDMWAYEVSGKNVLRQMVQLPPPRSRKAPMGDRRPPSPLIQIQPDYWLPEYTSDLLDLLHVLGRLIALEPKQADLLERICSGPLRKADELREAGALMHHEQKPVKAKHKSKSKA
jgi:hypothetical protein